MRETYQYMPKKVSYQYNTNIHGHMGASVHGLHGTARNRDSRPHRVVPGSVFSNDSSNPSIAGFNRKESNTTPSPHIISGAGKNPAAKKNTAQTEASNVSNKISSSDNVSINNETETFLPGEQVKHIHFAINDTDTNFASLGGNTGSKVSEENLSRHSGGVGDFVSKTGIVASTSFQNEPADTGKVTHFTQRRSSFKGRRTSLKYRIDRNARSQTNTSSGNNMSVRRKLSHGTNFGLNSTEDKQQQQDNSEYNSILNVPNANIDEVLISEEDSVSNNYNTMHGGSDARSGAERAASTTSQFHHSSDNASSTVQEFCEVDEVDFNRCFPWIKVIYKL
jgi:hypothetical protein